MTEREERLQEIIDYVNRKLGEDERRRLITEYGEEKAEEIILDRDLGELTYEIDDARDGADVDTGDICAWSETQ
jgi:hypothetical protein